MDAEAHHRTHTGAGRVGRVLMVAEGGKLYDIMRASTTTSQPMKSFLRRISFEYEVRHPRGVIDGVWWSLVCKP